MKSYGNAVKKYASKATSSKYKNIAAENISEYRKKQLADLERFLKDDFKISVNRDNQEQYNRNIGKQKKEIENEIARLKAQIAGMKAIAQKKRSRAKS